MNDIEYDFSKKAVIMMATYNGEAYLKEQLDSIRLQTFSEWKLYISDDQSNDKTRDIIDEYHKMDARIHCAIINEGKHGPFANYYHLIRYIKANFNNKFLYYFYCDQDDIWVKGNYSVGLRIYCADRKKTQWQKAKIPSPQVIFMDFCM